MPLLSCRKHTNEKKRQAQIVFSQSSIDQDSDAHIPRYRNGPKQVFVNIDARFIGLKKGESKPPEYRRNCNVQFRIRNVHTEANTRPSSKRNVVSCQILLSVRTTRVLQPAFRFESKAIGKYPFVGVHVPGIHTHRNTSRYGP